MTEIAATSLPREVASEAGREASPPGLDPSPPSTGIIPSRSCTCHPDEAPIPCQRKYALSECVAAAAKATLSPLERTIERMLNDPACDMDLLERLFAFDERRRAKQAEIDFNAAKGRILKKLAGIRIVKTKSVGYDIEKGKPEKGQKEAFKYVPLEEIDRHLRPLLSKDDMDLSYSNEAREGGGILVRGRLKHLPGGHFEDSFMPAPLDTSGGKNNVQAVGSTNSYLRRYVACNIFNIVVVGDDDDGTGGTIDNAQAKNVRELMIAAGADEALFLKYMHAPSVDEIAYRDYRKAVSALEGKISKKEKANDAG